MIVQPRALAQEYMPSAASSREVSREAEGLLLQLRGVGEHADDAQ